MTPPTGHERPACRLAPPAAPISIQRRGLPALLCLLVAAIGFATPTPAQGGGSGFQTEVRFVNFTNLARREWGLATVPFPQGVWTAGRSFAVRGVPSEIRPFGARWPDGSVRYGQLAARIDLQPHEELLLLVEELTPNLPPFRFSPWVAARIAAFDLRVVVGLPGGQIRSAGLVPLRVVESSDTQFTAQYRDRIPDTQFVYDLWVTWFADQDNAHFELRLTSSMVGDPEYLQPVDWVLLATASTIPIVRGPVRQRLAQTAFNPLGLNLVALLGGTNFYDGQAHDWFGELLFVDPRVPVPDLAERFRSLTAAQWDPLYGIATNWPSSGAWGPFGYLPDPPAWITDGGPAAAVLIPHELLNWYLQPGEMWEDRPLALREYPAVTGTQHDFGVGKFVDVFVSGMPHRLEEIRFMAGEEAMRPVHHREPDGAPVLAANHPLWVARAGRTHWSASVSPDRLGKTTVAPSMRDHAHGWFGKDHEHWSSLVLSSAYLLTGSHSLRAELDNDAELFLSSHTVPSLSPGSPANSIGNGRSLGRVMLTMAWNHLVTGRADVATRMEQRVVECVIPQHHGLNQGGTVLPLDVVPPDPRNVGSGEQWVPWQEAQAVLGLEAAARVTDSAEARRVTEVIARNLVLHGWRLDFENTMIAYAIRYLPGGAPIPPQWMNSPEYYAWPSSPASFNIWSLPSTRIALAYARRSNDPLLEQRALGIDLATQALRLPPRSGPPVWDAFADWDCIR
jgi:hypothetical protein